MKKMLAWLAVCLFWLPGALAGDAVIVVIDNKLVKADKIVSPKITLQGAEQPIEPGDIVIIKAAIEDEYPTYVKKRELDWNVSEGGFAKRVWKDNNQVMFGAGVKATRILVEVKAKFTYTVGTEDIVVAQDAKVEVQIGNAPVPPDPGPDPGPGPDVPTLTGAAKFAYDTAMTKGPATRASAKVVADSFKQIAAQIGHNPNYNDVKTLLTATKESNRKALTDKGYDVTEWSSFGPLLQEYLWGEYQAGRLKKIDEYKAVWEDIARGLSQVK